MQSRLLVIATILLLSFSYSHSFEMTANSPNDLKFTQDIFQLIEGVAQITMEGKINSDDTEMNKLGAFLNIAGKSIPLLESMGLTEQKLEFIEKWCYNYAFFSGCTGFTFEFYVGWRVTNGTAQDYEYLNVTYVPYVRGDGQVYIDLDTWAYEFDGIFKSQFANIYAPISTQFNFAKDIEFCYDGNAVIQDPNLLVTFETKVKSCQADMADNIMHPSDFGYTCTLGSPIVIPIINATESHNTYYNILSRTCLTLHKS